MLPRALFRAVLRGPAECSRLSSASLALRGCRGLKPHGALWPCLARAQQEADARAAARGVQPAVSRGLCAWRQERFGRGSRLFGIAMNGGGSKRGDAYGNVFGAFSAGGAIADPFAAAGQDSLAGRNLPATGGAFHLQDTV